jgi:hypothetical protein
MFLTLKNEVVRKKSFIFNCNTKWKLYLGKIKKYKRTKLHSVYLFSANPEPKPKDSFLKNPKTHKVWMEKHFSFKLMFMHCASFFLCGEKKTKFEK